MSELVCNTCGAKIEASAGQRPATCPTCHAPFPASESAPAAPAAATETATVAPIDAGGSGGLMVFLVLILLLVIAGGAGLFWWLSWSATTSGPVAVAAARAKKEEPITVGPARKATENVPEKPLVVRAEAQGDTDEASRKALAEKLVDFLATLGISSDPDLKEPVVRLRAAGPFMTEISQRSGFKKVTGSPIKAAVCIEAYLDVLDAKGLDIVGRSHPLTKNTVESYVIVKDARVDYQKDKAEEYPDAIKEAWQKLPETVAKSIFSNQKSNPKRLLEVVGEHQKKSAEPGGK